MSRGRVSRDQSVKLLDLMSEDEMLVDGKVSYLKFRKEIYWKRVAVQLNAVQGGVLKNSWKWCKTWVDWKTKTIKKANIIFKRKQYSDGDHTTPLTDLEIRLLKLVNYPMHVKADIDKFNVVTRSDDIVRPADFHMEFLVENYNDEQLQDRLSADEQSFDIQEDTEDKNIQEESSLDSESIKIEKVHKPCKTNSENLQEYKIKTTLELEKKKIQQRSEELRLKALELKMKGDELRLKEIEMNKINYLTNIEEEKLKCFRDISSSLKELLERTRNGR